MNKETRREWLHVRLTPSEAAELRQRAQREGRRLSDLARVALMGETSAPAIGAYQTGR